MQRKAEIAASVIGILSAVLFSTPVNGDVVFGGEAGITDSLLITGNATPVIEQQLELNPVLSVWSTSYEFTATGSLELSQYNPAFGMTEFYVGFYPLDFLEFRVGRFPYLPGTAELFSNTNYSSRTDYEKLFSGSLDSAAVANDLIQATAYFGSMYAKATFLPLRKDFVLPAISSPWFPDKDFPKSVDVQILLTTSTILLDAIYYTDDDSAPPGVEDFGAIGEVGMTFGSVDLSFLYHYGYDYAPLVEAEFIPHGLYDSDPYDIALTPVYRKSHAVGLNASTSTGGLRAWVDISYRFQKSFAAQKISFFARNTPIIELPYLAATGGASYEFAGTPVMFLVEGRYGQIFGASDFIAKPSLNSALAALIDARFFNYLFRAQVAGIYSFEDGSAGIFSELSFEPSDELSLAVTYPLFLGDADTELGQYSENHLITVSLDWRF